VKLCIGNIKICQLLVLVLVLLFSGCRSTRFVPDDRYLLSDVNVNIDNNQVDKEEVVSYLRQKENLKILGFFKFHLWMYNLSNKNKAESWLRNIGEPPVIYDPGLHLKSIEQITQHLYNKGFYHAEVKDSVSLKQKKAKVYYFVKSGDPFLIRNISYNIKDSLISKFIFEKSEESLIKVGSILDVDVLDEERTRIRTLLGNHGYYKFVEEFIHFKIDTSFSSSLADLELIIENPRSGLNPSLQSTHRVFNITGYEINIQNHSDEGLSSTIRSYSDTMHYDKYVFYHNGKLPIKPNVILKSIENKPGELYRKTKEERTYNNLFSTRQFKYVNMQFFEDPNYQDSLQGSLIGKIFLPMQVKQNYSLDIEGTYSAGNFGVAGNINYQHKNLFGGAEIFDFKLTGATERQFIEKLNSEFIMNEIGAEAKLSVPGFLFPVLVPRMKLYSMPFTFVSAAYKYQEQQRYTKSMINATLGSQWKSSSKCSHYFNLVDLNSVQIFRYDSAYFSTIKDLYFKSTYTDHVISATSYSFIYNDQTQKKRPDYHYFRMSFESAGNTLWAISKLTNRDKFVSKDPLNEFDAEYYKFLNTRFAQYLKADFDYRYGYRFDKYNSVASRAFLGIAFPYGNYNVVPIERRFYTGGADGVRAWPVRSLGPGSYVLADDEYPYNQSGDIKIEANVEYRFKLLWSFEGALFVDAGNIWAINNSDNREGAVFKFNQFYDEFAVGTGVGLRLVTNYFVVRLDLGMKLRDPSRPVGSRWILGNRSYKSSDFNWNIAIGYPF
jgi:hypothetical protein